MNNLSNDPLTGSADAGAWLSGASSDIDASDIDAPGGNGMAWSLPIAAIAGPALLDIVIDQTGAPATPIVCDDLEDIARAALGGIVVLRGRLPRRPIPVVRLRAAGAPRSTLWRWTVETAPARRMRPLCRALDARPHRTARQPDPAQAREKLRRGDLDGALDQFARACLAGHDSVACNIARAVMEFAATHPFARTPKLGALPAALLGKVDA